MFSSVQRSTGLLKRAYRFLSFLLAYAHAQAAGKTPEAPEEMLMKQTEFLSTQMIKTQSEEREENENEGVPQLRAVRAAMVSRGSVQAGLGV